MIQKWIKKRFNRWKCQESQDQKLPIGPLTSKNDILTVSPQVISHNNTTFLQQNTLKNTQNSGCLITQRSKLTNTLPKIPTISKKNLSRSTPLNKFQTFTSIQAESGMASRTAVVLLMGFLGMFYQATQLPPPQINESSSQDLSVTSQRIRLKDGRFLAYREKGVSMEKSKYRIIVCHGFGSSKDMNILASQELIDELGIYFLLYDRPGYGESDPNPNGSIKNEASDIQELAEQLLIGSKFHVIGVSMGSYSAWSCLKYIPDRLAGVALIVPLVNYRWPSLPYSMIREDYRRKVLELGLWLSNYAPRLLHWWVSQTWIPSTSVLEKNPIVFNDQDIEILKIIPGFPMLSKRRLKEQRVFATLQKDFMMAFGDWEFDPIELSNPFPQNESSVHIWQGYEDKVVPYQLQRYVSGRLPWIQYHEVPDGGHLIVHYKGLFEAILRALLVGEEQVFYRQRPVTAKSMS